MSVVPYGIVYLTSRLLKGEVVKRYIGLHKLHKGVIEDGYLGSGKLLKLAIKKYGRQNFIRETLQECYSRKELNDAEARWVAHFDATRDKSFYNLADGGMSTTNLLGIEVHQYTLEGDYVASYPSMSIAASIVGNGGGWHIQTSCRNSKRTAYGFNWSLEKHDRLKAIKQGHQKIIYQYCSEGIFIKEFKSLKFAAKEIGLDQSGITMAAKKGTRFGGLRWSFEKTEKLTIRPSERHRPVKCYTLKGEFVREFESISEASRFFSGGINSGILLVCQRRQYSSAKHQWRFSDDDSDVIPLKKPRLWSAKPVNQIDPESGDVVATFETTQDAEKFIGGSIRHCFKTGGKSKGYFWQRAD